ncbi:MAG: hypothetical protein JXA14_02435 [Anaerolineae bacterium]|nr:hypothetical protein [Anaerolineae bacterium]
MIASSGDRDSRLWRFEAKPTIMCVAKPIDEPELPARAAGDGPHRALPLHRDATRPAQLPSTVFDNQAGLILPLPHI